MADLSQLFAPQPTIQQRQGRRNPFALAGPQAAGFARKIAMREAMSQNLSPDSGDPFFQFVGNRLMELGDAEGALAVSQRRQEMLAAESAGQQQAFENRLAISQEQRAINKANREASAVKPPDSRKIRRGNKQITQEFNPATGQFEDIAEGNAFAPPNSLTINNGSDLGAEIAAIQNDDRLSPEVKEQAVASIIQKATQTPDQRDLQKIDTVQNKKAEEVRTAGARLGKIAEGLTTSALINTEAQAKYRSASSRLATTLAKFRTPGTAEPNKDVIDEIKSTFPQNLGAYLAARQAGQDPVEAVIAEIMNEVGAGTAFGAAQKDALGKALGIDPSRITNIEIIE